jgi:hypothetical protein
MAVAPYEANKKVFGEHHQHQTDKTRDQEPMVLCSGTTVDPSPLLLG